MELTERSETVTSPRSGDDDSDSPHERGLTVESNPNASREQTRPSGRPKTLREIIMGNLTESEIEEMEAEEAAAAAAEEDDGEESVIPERGRSFGEEHEIPQRIADKQTEIIPSRGESIKELIDAPLGYLKSKMEMEALGFVKRRRRGGVARTLPPLAEDPEEEVVQVPLEVQPEIGRHLYRHKAIYPTQLYSKIQSDSFEPIIIDRFDAEEIVANEIPEEEIATNEIPEEEIVTNEIPEEEIATNEIPEEEELRDIWNETAGEISSLFEIEGAAGGEAPDTVFPYANVFYRFEDGESGGAWGGVYPDQEIFEPQFADEEEMSRVIEYVPGYPRITSRSILRITRDERAAEATQKAQERIRHLRQPLFCQKCGEHRDVHGIPRSARIKEVAYDPFTFDPSTAMYTTAESALAAVRAASRPESFLYVSARSQDRLDRMRQDFLEAHAMHEAIGDEVVTREVSTRRGETTSRRGRRPTTRNVELATREVSTRRGGTASRTGRRPATRSEEVVAREVSTRRGETTSRRGRRPTTRSEEVVTREVSTRRGETTSRTGRRPVTRSEEVVSRQVSTRSRESESRMGSRAAPGRQISTRREEVVSRTEGRATSRPKVTPRQKTTLGELTRRPPWRY
ncbi:uncharacterized protein LOC106878220 isoform X2 [Octopus bimaculoides]|nr:uncharacterized protein LOC106878220 isoform X2 [Octopus bimaculoides]|eukprot:XP_014782859.1 PREDICTED: uncharacterized protein LOC106878220 isoform X3 [Octopus bimaculoides]